MSSWLPAKHHQLRVLSHWLFQNMHHHPLQRLRRQFDLIPLAILLLAYGLLQWLPFEIFGWLQNEDGLLEWASVVLLLAAAVQIALLLRRGRIGKQERWGWLLLALMCLVFAGEELSWGERLHGYGVEALRAINTQEETNLHNIRVFQKQGLLHLGWAGLGLALGASHWWFPKVSVLPAKRLCLYFLIPSVWYVAFEFCRKPGVCWVAVANHQELYEFLIALGLFLHCRMRLKQATEAARGVQP